MLLTAVLASRIVNCYNRGKTDFKVFEQPNIGYVSFCTRYTNATI